MNKSDIPYLGYGWAPVTGCSKLSAGCAHCYAESMTRRFWRQWGREAPPNHFKVKLHPERLEEPLKRKKPSVIGTVFMGDLFHCDVPDSYIAKVFETMQKADWHTFMVLTKRVERMAKLLRHAGWWNGSTRRPRSHIWLGASVEDQETLNARAHWLIQTPATRRFISYEPAIGGLDARKVLSSREVEWCPNENCDEEEGCCVCEGTGKVWGEPRISLLIAGGESGSSARYADPAWFRSVRDQCKEAGVKFYMKQMSGRAEIPDDLQIQEWPT